MNVAPGQREPGVERAERRRGEPPFNARGLLVSIAVNAVGP
jgi:hypothetical protein